MYKVKESPIHGRGLFAKKRIPKGTLLGELKGEYTVKDGPYVLWIEEDQGFQVKNDFKYINHNAEPNAAYFDDLTVITLRDIAKGEEITHNYAGDEADEVKIDFAEV